MWGGVPRTRPGHTMGSSKWWKPVTLQRWGHVVFTLGALLLVSHSRTILRTPRRRAQDPSLRKGRVEPFPGALEPALSAQSGLPWSAYLSTEDGASHQQVPQGSCLQRLHTHSQGRFARAPANPLLR